MRRNFLSSIGVPTILAAALLPAGSLWAASANSAAQDLNQIAEQTYQIQSQADQLESYIRSGAHDWNSSAGYTTDIAGEASRIWALLDQVAAQPGASNDFRMQVKKMKTMTDELAAFNGNALHDLDPHAMGLRKDDIVANTSNIEERCDMLRAAAQSLASLR